MIVANDCLILRISQMGDGEIEAVTAMRPCKALVDGQDK